MRVRVIRAGERLVTEGDGTRTAHSFSFGAHYDPTNTGVGPLIALNDETLEPGCGYPPHHHRDVEILTWVLSGVVHHTDDVDPDVVLVAGMAQRTGAGTGITHAERNAGPVPARFVQMWVVPDRVGLAPEREVLDLRPLLTAAQLVVVASGSAAAKPPVLRLRREDAHVLAGRLTAGRGVLLPAAPFLHVYVVSGRVTLRSTDSAPDEGLLPGDAARLVEPALLTAADSAEVLVFAAGQASPMPAPGSAAETSPSW